MRRSDEEAGERISRGMSFTRLIFAILMFWRAFTDHVQLPFSMPYGLASLTLRWDRGLLDLILQRTGSARGTLRSRGKLPAS